MQHEVGELMLVTSLAKQDTAGPFQHRYTTYTAYTIYMAMSTCIGLGCLTSLASNLIKAKYLLSHCFQWETFKHMFSAPAEINGSQIFNFDHGCRTVSSYTPEKSNISPRKLLINGLGEKLD